MLFFFDPVYFLPYFLSFLQNISNFIFIGAVILLIHQYRIGERIVWQVFLIIKLALDLIGNNYDFQTIKAYFHMDARLGWVALLFFVAIYIPGYIILFQEAFSKKTTHDR